MSTATNTSPTERTATNGDDALPRWDVSTIYPSLDSREFAVAHEALVADVARLASLYDRHDVREGEHTLDDAAVAAFDEVIAATNEVLEQLETLDGYVYAFVSTDSGDTTAQARMSEIELQQAEISKLLTRLGSWVRALGVDDLVGRSGVAAEHEWPVRKAATRAEHQMTEAEEALAADLRVTGSSAWGRLYGDLTSTITATVHFPDGPEVLPIFRVRGLAADPDPAVREAAYRAELAAWAANAVPIAAAMNAIKGETLTLCRHRGWRDPLEMQLFGQSVDRATLDAMLEALLASLPDFRRYLRAKARLLDKAQLAFWDLFAPVGASPRVAWDEATDSVERAFAGYSPQLHGLARRALDESWIDVAPRKGKVGGAFCMPIRAGESRVLLNWNESFDGVQTLAHELGHAYHNLQLTDRSPLQQRTPAALAETASIFCETIMVAQGLARTTERAARLAILDVDLQGACQVIVDIYSRFLFERRVFERRAATTLSIDDLCGLMREAQLEAYGDGLDPEQLHPYMWAAKPHYYGSTFYNWPYAYGLLFGIGLYARYERDPDRFRAGYDDLLSATGLTDAAGLAARFDIDVRDLAFWTSSFDVVRGRIDELEALAERPAADDQLAT